MRKILNNEEKFKQRIPFGCAPPSKESKVVPRYLVVAGTKCDVMKITSGNVWHPYVTKVDVGFEKYERYIAEDKCYEFRHKAWVLCVHRSKVKHREDSY